jgi:hypothetical protein
MDLTIAKYVVQIKQHLPTDHPGVHFAQQGLNM